MPRLEKKLVYIDQFAISSMAAAVEAGGEGRWSALWKHVFQAGPLALSVMVGHLWNRMPMTQLYEDLGPGAGYAPTFLI